MCRNSALLAPKPVRLFADSSHNLYLAFSIVGNILTETFSQIFNIKEVKQFKMKKKNLKGIE